MKKRKHVQIKYSYDIWSPLRMKRLIRIRCAGEPKYYLPYIIEWWLHNIGYYLTKPFTKNAKVEALNERFKHVDLMVEVTEE